MATMLEIARGISQVLANAYDGAVDSQGQKIEIGLKREEGHPIHDSRVIDGFSASIMGDVLRIKYHAECKLKEVHNSQFESEINLMIEKVKNYLTREYRSLTGSPLSLSAGEECQVMVQYISRIRTSIQAHKDFKINGADAEAVLESSESNLDSATQRWLELGGLK